VDKNLLEQALKESDIMPINNWFILFIIWFRLSNTWLI
jgi:hypothetical protein